MSNVQFMHILNELEGIVPENQLKSYIFRMVLLRISNKDYDKQQAERFKGKTPAEIKEILIEDILNGKDL